MGAALQETRTLIDELFAEQHRLTAVERFARYHEEWPEDLRANQYRALLPARAPSPGEQYGFAVDLDACSGCKACVTACHNLNGLDEDETWRSVGLLHGGSAEAPVQTTVTTACHHCVDPACLNGCPVLAYEKDRVTGIVRHLDDQCIGCQYCILKCPYDVPKYSARRGIVRKCDMCSNRLSVGEAPACAQACPNGAISITIVSQTVVAAQARKGDFLPGSPNPAYTLPTTRYNSARTLPDNLAPADQHYLRLGQAHPALTIMLVLTQLSVGAFCVDTLLRAAFPSNLMTRLSMWHALVAFGLGLLAIGASRLHLGRPGYAWRAVLGWRTSWLSREILAFGLFAALSMVEAVAFWVEPLRVFRGWSMAVGVSVSGLTGVFASVMVYHDTRRRFWSVSWSAFKFFGTAALLGTAAILFLSSLQGLLSPAIAGQGAYHELTRALSAALIVVGLFKLAGEIRIFLHLRDRQTTDLKRTARLMSSELAELTTARFSLGVIGGIFLPLAIILQAPVPGLATLGVTGWVLFLNLVAELLERHLFFVAVSPEKMPGGIV